MHDWCPVSRLCTRCGTDYAEFVNWNGSCFPTPIGTAFTLQTQRMIEAFYGPFPFEDYDQIRRLDA